MSGVDAAETDCLSGAIGRILPALEDFNRFQGQDLAGRQRSMWMAGLNQPLPERGVGLDQVFDDLGEPYHHFTVEHSAPSRGVQVWAILKEIGAQGMRERVIRHNDFARHLASRVEEDDRLELLAAPTLSICCFRYRPPQLEETPLDDLNAEIAHRLRADGAYVPSTTRVGGKFAIRPCYINPRTSLAEVDGLADRVREIGDALMSRGINDVKAPA